MDRYDFQEELARHGPDVETPPCEPKEAAAYCRALAETAYENFTVVSWLLPRRYRQPMFNIYAYCRWSDDLADEVHGAEESLRLLDWWEGLLDQAFEGVAFEGVARHPVMVALSETVRSHRLSKQPFADLLRAFRQDQSVTRYDTLDDLLGYCRYSANPVGRIILELAESYDATTAPLSDSVCTALQLANFWQDVARDYEKGRVYLPADARRRCGYTDEQLRQRRATPEFRALLKELCDDAEARFDQGRALLEHVPRWLRLDIDLFIRGGMAVLGAIRRQDYDVWSNRPTVSKIDKAKLLAKALIGR